MKKCLLISHHTGTTISKLLPQIRASTAKITFERNSQTMIERVATFLARQCHGRGRKSDKAAIIATGPNSECRAEGMMNVGRKD